MSDFIGLRWTVGWALVLVMLWARAALASNDPVPSSARPSTAAQDEKALLRQGSECFLRQDYEGARVALEKAYALSPRADTTLRLGIAELQSGHPVEAVQYLGEYLKHTDEPSPKLELVRTKWLPRAEAATARVDVYAGLGAEVRLDGVVQETPAVSALDELSPGRPSLSIVVGAGGHDVSARLGTSTETEHIAPRGGDLVEVHFQRLPDASAPPPASAPGVALRQEDVGSLRADRRLRAKWITVVTLGSAALAATGVAVGFSVAFEQNASDARALRQAIGSPASSGCQPPSPAAQCPQLGTIDDAEQRNGALATGFYIAGGAAAALAAATWVLWPESHSSELRASPVVGRGTTGFALTGIW